MLYATIMVCADLCVVLACEFLTGGEEDQKELIQAEGRRLAEGEVKQKGKDLMSKFKRGRNKSFNKTKSRQLY